MRVAICGYGEIGSAIGTLYREAALPEPLVHDPALGFHDSLDVAALIHVAVPAKAVREVCVDRPLHPLYIVHSTVPVGTCRELFRKGARIVHAPVRGVHPHLAAGMRTFTMPVAGDDRGARDPDVHEAIEALRALRIRPVAWPQWETTELAKILCTTRLGVDVLWMRHVHDMCERHGVRFDLVYTEWTKQYGDGYEVLGHWEYRRPVLRPQPGPIGGHCVLPNAEMLARHSSWAKMVAIEGHEDWQPGVTAT